MRNLVSREMFVRFRKHVADDALDFERKELNAAALTRVVRPADLRDETVKTAHDYQLCIV